MKTFCIDIGNTHTHYGVVSHAPDPRIERAPTELLDDPDGPLARALRSFSAESEAPGFAFCSVVPAATNRLHALFKELDLDLGNLFELTWRQELGMKISYPQPEEIGQDRLANAVAATAFYPLPCIVIDMGTAVTFDIVTASGGYEGGIIAPGLRIMTNYLHQQTALLPDIDDELEVEGAIGKSTRDAMKIGCAIGFRGMVQALLDAVASELKGRGESTPTLLATGGTARFLQQSLRQKLVDAPAITLQGLAEARKLNRGNLGRHSPDHAP